MCLCVYKGEFYTHYDHYRGLYIRFPFSCFYNRRSNKQIHTIMYINIYLYWTKKPSFFIPCFPWSHRLHISKAWSVPINVKKKVHRKIDIWISYRPIQRNCFFFYTSSCGSCLTFYNKVYNIQWYVKIWFFKETWCFDWLLNFLNFSDDKPCLATIFIAKDKNFF